MNRVLNLKLSRVFLIFALLDIVCIGMGMGVPIFCILFGVPSGYYFAHYVIHREPTMQKILKQIFLFDLIAASTTMLGMLIIWSSMIPMLFDPTKDLAKTGIPMILYEPRASLIGWLVLMMLISPFLQYLTALFGSFLGLLRWSATSRDLEPGKLS